MLYFPSLRILFQSIKFQSIDCVCKLDWVHQLQSYDLSNRWGENGFIHPVIRMVSEADRCACGHLFLCLLKHHLDTNYGPGIIGPGDTPVNKIVTAFIEFIKFIICLIEAYNMLLNG
jgi:hypothetical protein